MLGGGKYLGGEGGGGGESALRRRMSAGRVEVERWARGVGGDEGAIDARPAL